jgi:nucleoside-diphosphate-sugar epimerase
MAWNGSSAFEKFFSTEPLSQNCRTNSSSLSLGTGFGQVRSIAGIAREEMVLCTYCFNYEPRYGESKYDAETNALSWCEDMMGVHTTRLGYILGSPRLTKGYKAAREFKAPRKGSS